MKYLIIGAILLLLLIIIVLFAVGQWKWALLVIFEVGAAIFVYCGIYSIRKQRAWIESPGYKDMEIKGDCAIVMGIFYILWGVLFGILVFKSFIDSGMNP